MHHSKQSIRFHFMWLFAVLVLPVFLLFGWFNYVNARDRIIQDATLVAEQTKGYMSNYIRLVEDRIEFATASYTTLISEALLEFEDAYQQANSPEFIDLAFLKAKYNGALEFYLINASGEIVNATIEDTEDLGGTFSGGSYNRLTRVRRGSETEITPVMIDANSGVLRKWGYRSSPDCQYILQVATGENELKQYQNLIDFSDLNPTKTYQNQYINAAIFNRFGMNLCSTSNPIDTAIQGYLDEVFASGQDLVLYTDSGLKSSEYIFLNDDDLLPDNDKVMVLGYDYTAYHLMISENFRMYGITFLIYILVMMVMIYSVTTRFVIKPLSQLSEGIEQLSEEDLGKEIPIVRYDQIGHLTHSFNTLTQRIRESMVTRRYVENLMDSVGDYVFILNQEFEIQQINRTLRDWFHDKMDSLLGCPLTDILPDFVPGQVREQLTSGVYRVNIELHLEQEDCSLLLLATFSNYYYPNGEIRGYICNAKDISKTRELLGRLQDRNRALQQEGERLLKCSSTDDLTGIYNRRYLSQTLFALENMRKGTPFSVIMFDIDHFKWVNDRFGHQTGDKILQKVTKLISSALRSGDVLGRYGGEEFLVILPGADVALAEIVAKRICNRVKECDFMLKDMEVTISGGVAEFQRGNENETIETLVKRADVRLYRAKELGRNRVVTKDE